MAATIETGNSEMGNSAGHGGTPAWNRPTRWGLTISAIAPLAAVLIGNALVLTMGSEQDAAYEAVSWNPPGWVIAAVWCVIYPLWGAARWHVVQNDALAGRAWWVVALIVWGLCYPVVVAFTDTLGSVIANGFSLVLALVAALRVRPASRTAFWLVAPSIVWLVIANTLGLQALQLAG